MMIFRTLLFILGFSLALPFSIYAQARDNWSIIWGNNEGLFGRARGGQTETLWSGGNVQKIIPHGTGWAILGDQGVLVSDNLRNWEPRNQGLPQKVIKVYEGREKYLQRIVQQTKNLAIDPSNPDNMAIAFKDAIYFSQNGGRNWQNLGLPERRANGHKAVALTTLSGELTVFASNNIYGVYFITPLLPDSAWTELNLGLELLETTNNPDEISYIAIASGTAGPQIYASQTFRRRIYRLDWEGKAWTRIWAGGSDFGTVDSLSPSGNLLRFVEDRGIFEMRLPAGSSPRQRQDLMNQINALPRGANPNAVLIAASGEASGFIALSELWLLDSGSPRLPERALGARNKEGIYLPINHAMDRFSLQRYLNLIQERNLNMIVIDMKDDHGRLRFTPQNPVITDFGRVFQPIDLEAFLQLMKERGIFTVARIVVFKDPEAASRRDGRYAVWDSVNNAPWQGYYDARFRSDQEPPPRSPVLTTQVIPTDDPELNILRTWYDEHWVDPYSEEIWYYNVSVAEELYRRGFDEIQFDYIRFPTDGLNLRDASYRWRDPGMDMDGAIMSFLRHARSRINAPISIDIYGANGWYRTGARTGQEVELLAPWVDIICPMSYPSHFEQSFLAHAPPEQRPHRIYYQGTRRTHVIARGSVVVRPWAQSFFLNVSYDREFYGLEYVRMQLDGARAAGNGGITYWNNLGRYDEVPFP